tara:strand:- start:598 stop:777 length:180 start_codon:yes stop_codon:yes gene_type:complete
MSTRTNGQPLWLIRPIIDNCIREDLAQLTVGTLDVVMARANTLHIETGHQHAVRRVEDE